MVQMGVPFPFQRVLVPVGYVWWPRTGTRPILLEKLDDIRARRLQFQEIFVLPYFEKLLDIFPNYSLQDETPFCGLLEKGCQYNLPAFLSVQVCAPCRQAFCRCEKLLEIVWVYGASGVSSTHRTSCRTSSRLYLQACSCLEA